MTGTATLQQPALLIGWDADRTAWLAARRSGLGASDVAAVLGFSDYRSPWKVWAEKTGLIVDDEPAGAAAELGNQLEPWLRDQLARILGVPVERTRAQLYAAADNVWQLCSPDGHVPSLGHGVECKTAGLAGGFGPPDGWTDDGIPLGYEFQVRWQMHVMGWPAVEVVALVANLGLRHYTITRDLDIEADLVEQVTQWWDRHVIGGAEPPVDGRDEKTLLGLYPQPKRPTVALDGTAAAVEWARYRDAQTREAAAGAEKKEAGARLKRLLGTAEAGLIDGKPIATWNSKQGAVDWQRIATDLAATAGVDLPDPNTYRKQPTRQLSVKDVTS